MRELLRAAGATALALAVAGVAVLVGDDRMMFVPPPEQVTEEFVRRLATGRDDRAMELVEPSSGIPLTTVRLGSQQLRERAGEVNHVDGVAGSMDGDTATAGAVVTTEKAGEIGYRFSLGRGGDGEWRITRWEPSSRSAPRRRRRADRPRPRSRR